MVGLWFLVVYCLVFKTTAFEVSLYLNGLSVQPCGCANSSGYVPKNVLPTRMQVFEDEAFLAYPRYRHGVPFTLGIVDLKCPSHPAVVRPFPYKEMQTIGDCRALQSVEDIFLDEHEVLWALDTGTAGSMETPLCVCPAKVVAMCARTGRVVAVIDLSNVLRAQARPQFVVAESCEGGSVYVYIADADGSSLWCVHTGTKRCGGATATATVAARRVMLPSSARCDALYLARFDNTLLLHSRGSADVYAVDTLRLRTGQLNSAMIRLGPSPGLSKLVFLGSDRKSTLFYRNEGSNEVHSCDIRDALNAATCSVVASTRDTDARLTVTAVAVAGRGRRSLLALAVDSRGFVGGRVGCVGAEGRIYAIGDSFGF